MLRLFKDAQKIIMKNWKKFNIELKLKKEIEISKMREERINLMLMETEFVNKLVNLMKMKILMDMLRTVMS